MPAIREVHSDGWSVRLDVADQILQVDVPEYDMDFRRHDFETGEDRLSPTVPTEPNSPISAAALLSKAKQFDDGLYAAVETAAQHGLGQFKGKALLLRLLTARCQETGALARLYAACKLGDPSTVVPADLDCSVHEILDSFLADERLSKPLGFYAWTRALSGVFRQDRLLQQPLKADVADALVNALEWSADAPEIYKSWMQLNARLTNPAAKAGLPDDGLSRAFMPASRSHEQVLFEQLYGDRPIPEGFDLMADVIARVRSGELDLTPNKMSGWYDVQTWSLGPLLLPDRMPEGARVVFESRYRKHLEELFRSALALARETHVKQLAAAVGGSALGRNPTIFIGPGLNVEPLPSLYSRRAESYRFVRSVLTDAFGPDSLEEIHRLSPDGAMRKPLARELASMECLFDGAAALARRDLGMEPESNDGDTIERFLAWRANLSADMEIGTDARMMVPVFYDLQRRKTKVWAFLGWRAVSVDVKYLQYPMILSVDNSIAPEPELTDRLSVLRRKFRKTPAQPPSVEPRVRFRGDPVNVAHGLGIDQQGNVTQHKESGL